MASVRVWQKKKLRLDMLTFRQRDMYAIGMAGTNSVVKRVLEAKGPADGPAKPLSKRYAIYKSRVHKGNRRNLSLTGQMLNSLKVRTVTDNRAIATLGRGRRIENRTVKYRKKSGAGAQRYLDNRDVGQNNQKREPWLVFSPVNRRVVMEKARQVLAVAKKRMLLWGIG